MDNLLKFHSEKYKAFIVKFTLAHDGQNLNPEANGHALFYKDDNSLPPSFLTKEKAITYVNENMDQLKEIKDAAWVVVEQLGEGGHGNQCKLVYISYHDSK